MTYYKCDRCGKDHLALGERVTIEADYRHEGSWHLCLDCFKAFREWLGV